MHKGAPFRGSVIGPTEKPGLKEHVYRRRMDGDGAKTSALW